MKEPEPSRFQMIVIGAVFVLVPALFFGVITGVLINPWVGALFGWAAIGIGINAVRPRPERGEYRL